jgi:hypothetical protein
MKRIVFLLFTFYASNILCSEEPDMSDWVKVNKPPQTSQQTAPQLHSTDQAAAPAPDAAAHLTIKVSSRSSSPKPLQPSAPTILAAGAAAIDASTHAAYDTPVAAAATNASGHAQTPPSAADKRPSPKTISAGVKRASFTLSQLIPAAAAVNPVTHSGESTDSMSWDDLRWTRDTSQPSAQSPRPLPTHPIAPPPSPAPSLASADGASNDSADVEAQAPLHSPSNSNGIYASFAACIKYLGCRSCFAPCCPPTPTAHPNKTVDHTK